jgi:hypothetical protein
MAVPACHSRAAGICPLFDQQHIGAGSGCRHRGGHSCHASTYNDYIAFDGH